MKARYQDAGYSPESFAEYDVALLPFSLLVMWLAGRVAKSKRLLQWLGGVQAFSIGLSAADWCLYQSVLSRGKTDAHWLFYFILSQCEETVGTMQFVIKVAFFNRLGKQNAATAGTMITFMASVTNFGDMWPETLAPYLAEAAGFDATITASLAAGSLVLMTWRLLARLEDPEDPGWKGLLGHGHAD